MRRFASGSVLCVVAFLAVGCGSSKSSTSSRPSSSAPASSSSPSGANSASTTTSGGSSGGNASGFCGRLAAEVDKLASYGPAFGNPQQAATLARIESDNAALAAAAPGDVHDAIVEVDTVAVLSRKALEASPADRATAEKAMTDAVKSAAYKTATADYIAWVTSHCGALAHKILTPGS